MRRREEAFRSALQQLITKAANYGFHDPKLDAAVENARDILSAYYDYEWLGRCDYPVGNDGPDVDAPCEEAAIVRVWWSNYDRDFMFLCPKHWEIFKVEEYRGQGNT